MRSILKVILVLVIAALFCSYQCSIEKEELRFLQDNVTDTNTTNTTDPTSNTTDPTDAVNQLLKAVRCFWLEEESLTVFNLQNLKRAMDVNKDNYWAHDASGRGVYFSICEDNIMTCKNESSQVLSVLNKDEDCRRMAGSIDKTNNWTLLNNANPSEGIKIALNSGEVCKDNKAYTTNFILRCNLTMKSGEYKVIKGSNFDSQVCDHSLEIESVEACPKMDFYEIWNFINKFKIVFGGVLITIGIFEVLFGSYLLIVTIFIMTCVGTTTILFILFFQLFLPSGVSEVVVWVILGLSLIIGAALGFVITKYKDSILGFLLGGYMGYILGILLYNMIFIHIKARPVLIYWIVILLSIGICVVLAYYMIKHIIIISTSFIGSYFFIRGISLYAGGFPNETYVMDLIRNEEYDTLSEVLRPVVYAYLAGWILLFIGGVIFQYRFGPKDDEKKNSNNLIEDNQNRSMTSK